MSSARWKDGNVGRLPLDISPWGSCEDTLLRVGDFSGGLKVSAIFGWRDLMILIVVHKRGIYGGSREHEIYRAEDWPLLCAWQLHRDFDWPTPEQDEPKPYLVRA
jgi:hypothetical protein